MMYARWWGDKLWTMVPGVSIVGKFLATFKEYPPSQVNGLPEHRESASRGSEWRQRRRQIAD
jgi:hypothetical protein